MTTLSAKMEIDGDYVVLVLAPAPLRLHRVRLSPATARALASRLQFHADQLDPPRNGNGHPRGS